MLVEEKQKQKLTITPTRLEWREGGYRQTIPINVGVYVSTSNKNTELDTQTSAYSYTDTSKQWSKQLRTFVKNVNVYIQQCIEKDGTGKLFETTFNRNLNVLLNTLQIIPNASFSKTIFEDDSFMVSSLYKNNQNHKLKLYEIDGVEKYICAVYIDEIIWVMYTLVQTIKEILGITIEIYIVYVNKDERVDSIQNKQKQEIYDSIQELQNCIAEKFDDAATPAQELMNIAQTVTDISIRLYTIALDLM